jgi:hypothetical protein
MRKLIALFQQFLYLTMIYPLTQLLAVLFLDLFG